MKVPAFEMPLEEIRASLGKLRTIRQFDDAYTAHVDTFASKNRRSGCWRTGLRLSMDPVEQSSITATALSALSKRSTKCDPMKPAPPVTKSCGLVIWPYSQRALATASASFWRYSVCPISLASAG